MKRFIPYAICALLMLSACEQQAPMPTAVEAEPEQPVASKKGGGSPVEGQVSPLLAQLNTRLEAEGLAYRIAYAEYFTLGETGQVGQTLFANDRGNRQTGTHFVPGDPRRGGHTSIQYAVDQVDGATASGLSAAQTTAAIERAMATWDAQTCSTLPIERVSDFGLDLGVTQALLGYGGILGVAADYTHAGWLPAAFFDDLVPGGGQSILGITLTFGFINPDDTPTDIDNNGKEDVFFTETYYNDAAVWAIDGDVDVESVALHEAGHGLSQAHFGKIFLTNANGKLHFAPRAVMNAAYSGIQQVLTGTDNGGHCSIWASWPNN